MKAIINNNKVEIKTDWVRIPQKFSKDGDRNYYNCELRIYNYQSKPLSTYEREKIEDYIRNVINED